MSAAFPWIVIPAKDPTRSKTRLAPALDAPARAALARALALRTIDTALAVAEPGRILLVSGSAELRAHAGMLGLRTIAEEGAGGLNEALALAAAKLPAGEAMLVVATDLPRLDAFDLVAMTESGAACAIAPDRAGSGTNALLCPAGAFLFRFGTDSRAAHRRAALDAGLSVALVERGGLAFDIDRPDDLAELRRDPPDWLPAGPILAAT